MQPAHRVVVGTAGHIDHGKTSLLEALTGTDCDRWAEEKERGITIDLGFAHLQDADLQVGFVDVPGHEKFLNNALAGLGGIRLVLLVIAADEGVKPQTREHLEICRLLRIPHAIVVLTKKDLVDSETLELAELEVDELLEPTAFAGSPIMAVSSHTGDGIPELKAAVLQRAREIAVPAQPGAPFRLPIDRAFQLKGLGAIVTGTLVSGQVQTGQNLVVLPRGAQARVRSIQVHGEERPRAEAGERTAIQLVGVDLSELQRGEELATPDLFASSHQLCVRLKLLADVDEPLTGWTPIRFHLYATETMGRMRPLGGPLQPGDEGLVEVRLEAPVNAVRDDRFIIRRPSPQATLGGGVVLDSQWVRRRGSDLKAATDALTELPTSLLLWVTEAGERGRAAAELAPRLGRRADSVAEALDSLVSDGLLTRTAGGKTARYVDPSAFQRVREKGKTILRTFLRANRLAPGMAKAEFIGQLLPERARDLASVYLRFLTDQKILVVQGDLVNQPGRQAAAALTGEENQMSQKLLDLIEGEGLTPPSPGELAHRLNAKPQILEGVQKFLIQKKKLVRLSSGLIISSRAVEQLQQQLLDSDWDKFGVPQFKERFGLSRKWAIPLLEHLDSVGTTRRLGNERQVVRRS